MKYVAALILWAGAVAAAYYSMVLGCGIHVASWPALIGFLILYVVALSAAQAVAKDAS